MENHLESKGKNSTFYFLLSIFFVSLLSIFYFLFSSVVLAQAASLHLFPSSGTYAVGANFTVAVKVASAAVSINAAEAILSFDPAILDVVSISKAGSIFTLWPIEPTFSNANGTITFGGGTQASFVGTAGRIIVITFRAQGAGAASVNFASGAVLAADGRGTNVLANMNGGAYTLVPRALVPEAPAAPIADRIPPRPFEIEVDNEGDATNPAPILRFEARDVGTGIDFYEIRVGEQEPIRITPAELREKPFRLPRQSPGSHTVVIRAVDRAGNSTVSLKDFVVEAIEPPVITKFSERLRQGDLLIVEGKSLPGHIVLVHVQKDQDVPIIREVKADQYGSWIYVHPQRVAEGVYTVWAKNGDPRGAISHPTSEIAIPVLLPLWLQIWERARDYLAIIIILTPILIGVLAIFFYVWHKISSLKRKIRKETEEVRHVINRAFQSLKKDIQSQIEFLDKKPGLSAEEKEIRDKLKEALDDSQKIINKEISDIEKELK
jgi:hypothetical protein